jgi:mRNA interferase MazF
VGRLAPGAVALVRFPFSDLSSSKLRPAVVLAHSRGVDWVLCQVTSNPYGDPAAVGGLQPRRSYSASPVLQKVRAERHFVPHRAFIINGPSQLNAVLPGRGGAPLR